MEPDTKSQGAKASGSGKGVKLEQALSVTSSDSQATQARIDAEVRQRTAAIERELADAREQLAAQQATLSLLTSVIENSPAVIDVKDLDGRYLMVNRQYEKIMGVRREALLGKTDHDLFASVDAARFREVDRRVLASGQPIETEEVVSQGNRLKTYLALKCPLLDQQGKPYAICGISTDISARKLAERQVQVQLGSMDLLHRITRAIAERQDLRSIFGTVLSTLEEQLPADFAAVCLYDASLQTLTLSRLGLRSHERVAAARIVEGMMVPVDSRCVARSLRGEMVYEVGLSDATGSFLQQLRMSGIESLVTAPLIAESTIFGLLIAGRAQRGSFAGNECDFLRHLSEHIALATHQSQLYTVLQQAYDELGKSQKAMLQQERLRALGQMASGVAHDINNAISPVTLYTGSLLERGGFDDAARAALLIIQQSIGDVAKTVARMREFSRPREAQSPLARINLNDLVLQVIDITRVRWRDQPQASGHVITVYADLAADLPVILGADSEIRDALVNLVFNAIDAMPQGGALTIRTACVIDTPGGRKHRARETVMLEVTDTGAGMTEEARSRCLEPFFSTKGERGTGLGLPMVYGMVQRHNAELDIDSAPGQGTKVTVRFSTLGIKTKSTPAPAHSRRPGPMRILVVDDDPLIIDAMEAALIADGHSVVTASGGQQAIDLFSAALSGTEPIQAVITDLGMPHVDGRQVAAAIKAADMSVRVIMLTGWGQQLQEDNDVPKHVDRVLNKPPTLVDLRNALAGVTVAV